MGEYHPEEPDLGAIKPCFTPSNKQESPRITSLIKTLALEQHIEGGYYRQTDESTVTIPSPYPPTVLSDDTVSMIGGLRPDFSHSLRKLSTTIFYYLTPNRPQGHFHRNRSRIIHTLHRGRGRYVLLHPDGHVETYVVGHDIENGEKLQWVVEGGVYKASFLLDAKDGENEGLLISETVVPGFEYADHEFLREDGLKSLLSEDMAKELEWLVSKHDASQIPKEEQEVKNFESREVESHASNVNQSEYQESATNEPDHSMVESNHGHTDDAKKHPAEAEGNELNKNLLEKDSKGAVTQS
ncbi:Fc.00g102660.m01.CDS01 [Cosmosporella sp. VM-42]